MNVLEFIRQEVTHQGYNISNTVGRERSWMDAGIGLISFGQESELLLILKGIR